MAPVTSRPRGGPPGFVTVLDEHHLAVPDLSGNNLLDSLTNIVAGSGIGLLFFVPGVDETLRVNGRACITREAAVLDACAVKARRPRGCHRGDGHRSLHALRQGLSPVGAVATRRVA